MNPIDLGDIRNITISGRIGSGATTLATNLAQQLGWEFLDGGKILRKVQNEIGASVEETEKRPDHFDLEYEERIKKTLHEEKHHIIQSHLAGFDAQGINGIFKIFVVCESKDGSDKADIRIDRLVNRDGISVDDAKYELRERDRQNLEKWRRLYADNDSGWVYWDSKYYDLIVNTFELNKEDALATVLKALGLTS
jgi:cytidylate kinase